MLESSVFAGRYRVVRPLGAGAMGAVYEVLDLDTDRRRALKVMHPRAGERPAQDERWRREARIAGQLDSRFIVDVLDVGVDEATGARFLVMELLRGEDLSRRLKRLGPLAAAEVASYLHQAALALDRMHRAGIVHRDLKPGNLFREEREGEAPRLKILDLGIAIDGSSHAAAAIAGTPLYMAPEQLRDGAELGAAADVFALGMVAFALLAGRPYWADEWEGCGDKLRFALVAVRGPQEPASIRAARYGVALPPELDGWFGRATAADPRLRFPSAGAAARSLDRALGLPPPAEDDAAGADAEPAGALPAWPAEEAPIEGAPTEGAPPEGARGARRDSTVTAAEVLAGVAPEAEESLRSPPAPRPKLTRRDRWKRRFAGSAGVVAAGLAIASAVHAPRGCALPPPRSPLESPTSVLACPVLEAFGVEAPGGWLGAAAASLLCERARLVLGGKTDRTLIPAELLAFPGEPTDDFPADPYADPGARSRSLEAARRRADAYFDGAVTKNGAGFDVVITLWSQTGELARASGRGRSLLEAVRDAMQPFIDQQLLPWASELDPAVRDFSRAQDPAAALALLDLSMAMIHNAGGLADECARLDELGDRIGEMAAGERYRCAYTLGLRLPDVRLPSDPTSPGAVAAGARILHMVQRGDDRQRAEEILHLFEEERSPWGRSVLAATASCLLQSSDPPRAAEMARRAVLAEPKNPTGELCTPWEQLLVVTRGTPSATSSVRAMRAWTPWNSYGWQLGTLGQSEGADALTFARRAYALSPLDVNVAVALGDKLLAQGAVAKVRNIVSAIPDDSLVHRLARDQLLVRLDASAARFGAALERAQGAMQITAGDTGWVRVQRLDVAWRALEIAEILGREETAKLADLIVERFLDPEPPPIDGAYLEVPLRIPAICARASATVAGRCFARFRALRDSLSGGILPETDSFTKGAERYAQGDFQGAARAWRPLLQEPAVFAAVMFEAMATTFERTGEPDLVERLAAAVPDTSAQMNGASLALVHAARSAARHGQRDRARALARRVIDAWSVADLPVPVVTEMRRLLASPE